MNSTSLLRCAVLCLVAVAHVEGLSAEPVPAPAGLTPNFLFSDNMVLQRDREAPVWGRAAPGENVRVTFQGRSAQATADKDGRWSVKVGPFPAGGPFEMTIETALEKQTIKNVLVGDVWFLSLIHI